MDRKRIHQLLSQIRYGGLAVRYWDGQECQYGPDPPTFRIEFLSEPPRLDLEDPVIALGEAYMDGHAEFSGSLTDLNLMIGQNMAVLYGKGLLRMLQKLMLRTGNSVRNKKNISHHYDLGNDFFSQWLDSSMTYSCAYFRNPADSLDDAQRQKTGHALKKLCIRPGDRLLDIGSGWGELIIRAALEYGAKAVGVTLSDEQYAGTKEKIARLGLEGQVEVRLTNYLDLDEAAEKFDRISSIGMLEHVGKANLGRYMAKIDGLLVPGGLSLLHNITATREAIPNTWTAKYIFPGGYIPSLREIICLLPEHDFHLVHLESLRRHYALTLDRWHENYSRHFAAVEARFGRRFARMWNLYLLASAASFRSGLEIYQMLFSKGLNEDVPMTFDFLYRQD